MSGRIYLIPTPISENNFSVLSLDAVSVAKSLRLFFVEEIKTAQKFLKRIDPQFPMDEAEFYPLSEHTPSQEIKEYIKLVKNKEAGVLSEAGLPCVADPGADLVLLAQQNGIQVVSLAGASSIFMALMASGLNGQNFAFNGYLPKDKNERVAKLKFLEKRSFVEGQTQIFMEAPYRNQAFLEDLLSVCQPETFLCVASDISGPEESVRTQPIKDWKKQKPSLPKVPTLFLIQSKK